MLNSKTKFKMPTTPTAKPKNIYDLTQIKRELNYLIKHNNPNNSQTNQSVHNNQLKQNIESNQPLHDPKTNQILNQDTAAPSEQPSNGILQKYKQLIFINNSKKFLNLVKRKTKLALFKQRSSSLNSLSEDPVNETKEKVNVSIETESQPVKNKRKYSLNK